MPNPYSFPVEPPILRQGNPNQFPQNEGHQPFSWNVGYSPPTRPYETRPPSVQVPTWYPPVVARDDGRLNAVDLGDQGWRNAPHQAMDFTSGDEWWRQSDSVTGDTGGSAELGAPIIASVGGMPPSPFDNPGLDWTGTTPSPQPQGEPTVETPTSTTPDPILQPEAPLFAPPSLDISPGDPESPVSNEWTTSPDDRRFLPGSGPNIRSFGNDLTLGEFLNTPLASMRYWEGYNPVGGGDVTYADTTTHTAGDIPTADVTPDAERQGAIDTQNLRDQGLLPPSSEQPTGEFNGWPQAGRLEPNAPEGMTIIGHDTITGQPIYRDAQGGLHVNPGTGTPVRGTTPGSGGFQYGGYGPGYASGTGIHYDWMTGHYESDHAPSDQAPGHGNNSLGNMYNSGDENHTKSHELM